MIGRVLAGLVVLACLLLLIRLLLPALRRRRFDAASGRIWARVRRAWFGLRRASRRLWTWRASRRHAERMADEAIRRARDVNREGNVYKPKFRGPRKPH